jgi:hypothetical protein
MHQFMTSPIRRILAFVLSGSAMFAGQSLLTNGSSGTIAIPDTAPYNALTDTRLEVRLTGIQPCADPAKADGSFSDKYVQNWFRIAVGRSPGANLFSLGCKTAGQWGIYENYGSAGAASEYLSPAEAEGKTDLIFRMQKDQTRQRYTVEIWTPDGVRIKEIVNTGSGIHKAISAATTAQSRFIRGGGTIQIAWMRWYTGVLALNSSMPKNSGAEKGDLGNWEFEGNLDDNSGNALHVTRAISECNGGSLEGCFTASTIHPPFVQATVLSAVAGLPMVLDASASFTYDDQPLDNFRWSQVSGPTKVKFSDNNTPAPSITGHVAGVYVFDLNVGDIASKQITVKVANADVNGLPLYPLGINQLTGAASIEFDLAGIPNAVDVVVTVKKPDGRDLRPVICKESPCTLPADARQKDHLYQLAFRDSAGQVLSTTEWIPLLVEQTDSQAVYSANAGKTWNKFGFYLMQNWPNWVGAKESVKSAQYFGKRMWMGVDGVPMVGENPAMWSQVRYIDGRASYNYQIQNIQDTADKYGWKHEDMLLHMNQNHRWATPAYRWTLVNRFDAFEQTNSSYTNGVLIGDAAETPAVFVDRSDASYSPAANDVVLSQQSPVLYIGYGEPFAEATFVLGTPGQGCSAVWEYWDGTQWTELVLKSTGPQNTLSGSGKVEWLPPATWQKKVVRTSRNKWWIRVRTGGCSTYAGISQILADNWEATNDPLPPINLTSSNGPNFNGTTPDEGFRENTHGLYYYFTPDQDCSANSTLNVNGWGAKPLREEDGVTPMMCSAGQKYVIWYRWEGHWRKRPIDNKIWRGWCENSPTRINLGLGPLEFDPTPPARCEARFRYQARILFGWAANNTSGNFTNVQGGQYTFARHIVDMSLPHLTRDGKTLYNGIFLDDLSPDQPGDNSAVAPNGRPLLFTEMGRHTFNQEVDQLAIHIQKTREYLRESNPAYTVGINSSLNWITPHAADWTLNEGANYGSGTRPVPTFENDPYHWQQGADRYKRENNPNGVKSLYTTIDSSSETLAQGEWVAWDRGNRGPISNWAGYLIIANENLVWFYCPNGGAYYTSSDEYLYWDEAPDSVLTEPVEASVGVTSQRVLTGDFSRWPDGTYRVRIGELGEFRTVAKVSGKSGQVTIAETLYNGYPAGTKLWLLKQGRLAMNAPPPAERIFRWGYYFPAMDIDVGVPDTEGYNGGERDLNWISAKKAGTCCPVARRDFTRAIILHVEPRNASAAQYTTYSEPIDLGGTYYPLRADGETGPGVTSIRLRSGEGVVLMKEPVY